MKKQDVERFKKLFVGNERSHGQYVEKTRRSFTVDKPAEHQEYVDHLIGKTGLGLVPILDSNNCHFGVIDIDDHDDTGKIDHKELADNIFKLSLPLTLCKSKSGDAHVYLFMSEPVPAFLVRNVLKKWANELGHPGVEIFPKQSKLVDLKDRKTGVVTKTKGNWINLPYMHGDDTKRVAVEKGGTESSFDLFLTDAESRMVNREQIEEFLIINHPDAPPCIQQILQGNCGGGYRNEAMYNLTVYFKRAYPDDFKDRVYELNGTIFDKPLKFAECQKTVNSASRGDRDYKYKCFEEPIRSHCNPEICLSRAHGITEEEATSIDRGDMPEFTDLIQYDSEPPMWQISVDNVQIVLSTTQLSEYHLLTKAVMEKLLRVLPPIKNKDWLNRLAGLMAEATIVETPDDASVPGMIRARLAEFIDKVDLTVDGTDIEERAKIHRGIPVMSELGMGGSSGRHIIFRGLDFVNYLKRMKAEELKGTMLWMALKQAGVKKERVRISGKSSSIWAIEVDEFNRTKIDPNFGEEPSKEEMQEIANMYEPKKQEMNF